MTVRERIAKKLMVECGIIIDSDTWYTAHASSNMLAAGHCSSSVKQVGKILGELMFFGPLNEYMKKGRTFDIVEQHDDLLVYWK